MEKIKVIVEIPFKKGDAENLKEVIETSLLMLEDEEVLVLPLKREKKTVRLDGRSIVIVESRVDISKKMKITKVI
jgi:hypothetical protein